MNSGTYSTELNDMLTNFVEYVDSFYGVNDPLYPLIKEGKPLSKVDILGATEKYLGNCSDQIKNIALGVMAIHLTEKGSGTFYLTSLVIHIRRAFK